MSTVQFRDKPVSIKKALDMVKSFCERILRGELHYREIPGFLISCYAGRTITYGELPNILYSITRPDFLDNLRKVLHEYLGDFEIHLRLEDGSKVDITYEPAWGVVKIYVEKTMNFGVPESEINYVYPDPIEDSISLFNGAVDIVGWAKGFIHNNELHGAAWIKTVVHTGYRTLELDEIRQMIKEMIDILEELLDNPKNFARFK